MYRKILVPLDGSPSAEIVLTHVQMLAKNQDAEIFLVQVIVDPLYNLILSGTKLAVASQHCPATQHADAQSYLDQIAARLREQGLRVSTHIIAGIVTDMLLDFARQHQTDLIVMTARGTNTVNGWQLGTVAYRIVHEAPMPVLLIHPELDMLQPEHPNKPALVVG